MLRSLIFHPVRLMAELSFEGRRILARDVTVESTVKGYDIGLDDVIYRPKNSDDDADPKEDEKINMDNSIDVLWKDFKANGKVVVSHY